MKEYDDVIRTMLIEMDGKMMGVLKKGSYAQKRRELLQLKEKLGQRVGTLQMQTFIRLCDELRESEREAAMLTGLAVGLRLNQISTVQAETFIMEACERNLE